MHANLTGAGWSLSADSHHLKDAGAPLDWPP
jgi:hypothetical protein